MFQIFFSGLCALTSALLNARKLFFTAAWSPAIANLVTIAIFCVIPLHYPNRQFDIAFANDQQGVIWLLALGTTLGIATMAIIQVAAVIRHGMSFSFSPNFSHPAVR